MGYDVKTYPERYKLGDNMVSYLAPTPRELGELIRGFRKERGWTQARLGKQVGLLPKTISALESGTGNVLLANAMRCLSALEVDVYLQARRDAAESPTALFAREPQSRSTGSRRRVSAVSKARKEKW